MFNMIKADVYRMNRSKGMIIFWLCIIGTYLIPLISRMPGGVSLGMPVSFASFTRYARPPKSTAA